MPCLIYLTRLTHRDHLLPFLELLQDLKAHLSKQEAGAAFETLLSLQHEIIRSVSDTAHTNHLGIAVKTAIGQGGLSWDMWLIWEFHFFFLCQKYVALPFGIFTFNTHPPDSVNGRRSVHLLLEKKNIKILNQALPLVFFSLGQCAHQRVIRELKNMKCWKNKPQHEVTHP